MVITIGNIRRLQMFSIVPMDQQWRSEVIDLFNHYVENGFAAFPDKKVPGGFFDMLCAAAGSLPFSCLLYDGAFAGFGLLRPYSPIPAFSGCAEITYFISPSFTGKGAGSLLCDELCFRGRQLGVTHILARISSLNEGSIRFHAKNGFAHCGILSGVGVKNGTRFDVVHMMRINGDDDACDKQ